MGGECWRYLLRPARCPTPPHKFGQGHKMRAWTPLLIPPGFSARRPNVLSPRAATLPSPLTLHVMPTTSSLIPSFLVSILILHLCSGLAQPPLSNTAVPAPQPVPLLLVPTSFRTFSLYMLRHSALTT